MIKQENTKNTLQTNSHTIFLLLDRFFFYILRRSMHAHFVRCDGANFTLIMTLSKLIIQTFFFCASSVKGFLRR